MCVLCKDTFSRSDILKRHFQKCSIRILERLGGIGRGSRSCLLLRPLQMGLGVGQVSRTGRITPADPLHVCSLQGHFLPQ
jgi:hypothetical protein